MADAQSNIKVSIDTTEALASIKNLQRQISAFHTSMAKSGAAANAVTSQMQQNLINSVNATGKFSAQMKSIKTTTESFTDSLQKNKFSMGEYFRYAGGASKTFGRLFKTEFETINKVARENVKDLQTQYIKMGRDANGAMKAIAVRPLALDMNDLATKTMIASEKQALLNQLLKQGSTNLLNFGKNTQWAGRQLMVGFTIPLMAVGSAAAKTFMDMETQAIRFKKVYGDLFTPQEESVRALKNIQDLGKEFTKYGIAVSSTVGLAAEAAAAGFQGVDLQRQTAAATKLSILGQVESQKALETTISLQNAFSMSSENLAESIDFLNAVENQTVLSLDDVSTAIPKAAPIVQQLGGDVKDLAFFMTAMKEGGINASEGANALKSGLASLINPTGKAAAMLEGFGINAKKIVVDNKGDLKKTVIEFATALNQLDPLNRAQAIEQMFGKFQFSRLSTLFANVTKEGTQAARVLDLAGSSVQELAALSEKELGMTSESAMNKFKGAVENLKLALVPVGEEFLKAVTPIAEFVTKILDKFNNLGDGTKKIIVTMTAIVAGLGPVLLMTFGLLANGLANIIKGFTAMKTLFNRTGQSSATLGTEVRYMTLEQRNAAAVAASLDQVHRNLAQTFTSETAAVNSLTAAYQRSIAAQSQFMPMGIPLGRGPIKKRAKGKPAVVGGTGNQDSELAFLMPGETVIPTKMSKKYGALINGMIADNIPGYAEGVGSRFVTNTSTSAVASHFDVTVPSELARTIRLVGDELKGFSTTVLKLTNKVDGEGYDLVKSQEELLGSVKDDNAVLAGGRSFGGTTTLSTGSRNTMFNAIGVKGEPFTLDALAEAGDQAAVALRENKVSTQKHTVELEQLAKEGATAKALLQDSNGATKSRIDYMRANAKQAITEGLLADARIKIDGKRITVEQAGMIADERLAKVDTELAALKKSGVTTEKQILEAKRKYLAAMIKSGTGEFVVAPSGTGGGVARDTATGRPRSSNRVSFLNQKAGERQAAYGGRGAVQVSALIAKDFALKGKSLVESATAALISGARSALRIASPSKEMNNVGANAGQSLVQGVSSKNKDAVKAGQVLGDAVVSGTKSGKASRAQGPAPIGPDMPAGATQLGIVAKPKQTRTQRLMSGARGVGGRMSGLGGGMGLLGANMGLSMLPDFAGKGAAQGALAGANLGMMFGPKGMAAGAAIGLVTSAYTTLIAKQKEHAAITRSVFSSSAAEIEMFGGKVIDTTLKINALGFGIKGITTSFGGLTPEVQALVNSINSLPDDDPLKMFVNSLKELDSVQAVTGNIRAKVAEMISLGGLPVGEAKQTIAAMLEAAGMSSKFGEVWAAVQKSVSSETAATTTMLNKLNNALGASNNEIVGNSKSWYEYDKFSRPVIKTYQQMNTEQKLIADSLKRFTGALTSGTLTADQFNARLNGIKNSAFNGVVGLGALRSALAETGDVDALAGFDAINFQLDQIGAKSVDSMIKLMALKNANITPEGAAKMLGKKYNANLPSHIKEKVDAGLLLEAGSSKEFQKILDKMAADKAKAQAALSGTAPYKDPDTGNAKDKLTIEEMYLKILDKEINKLEAKRNAQKDANDETQRQIDMQMKMRGLANQAAQAKISGNYLEASMLGQQARNAQVEFNKETELRKKEAEIAALKARAQAIKDGSKLTKVERSKVTKKANGGLIKGPGTGRSDSITATLGYAGGGSIRVSNGEFVVKASSVKDYGIGAMNAVNNGTARIDTNSGGTVYNINMPITSNNASPEGVANEVMRRLKVELNKNNKSNSVRM